MAPRPLVSIVTPVFNEEQAIVPYYQRLSAVLATLGEFDFELIFTNNRSTDGTAEQVLALRAKDPRVQLLTYSRNYGYQFSVLGGLRQAAGDAIITIDVDCEDPPELIPTLLGEWRRGFDIVYGERNRREEAWLITACRKIFYRLNKLVADSDIILDMAEFSLISAPVRDAVVASASTYPFLRAEIAHYGFERKGIPYDRQARIAGETHYNLLGMTKFAIGGILSSTTLPLRMAMYLLPLVLAFMGVCLALDLGWNVEGAFHLLVAAGLAYLAVSASFLSLYLARAYRNINARPLVTVDWGRSATNAPPERSPNRVPRLWSRDDDVPGL